MAVIHPNFLKYITTILQKSISTSTPAFYFDPILQLAEKCIDDTEKKEVMDFLSYYTFSDKLIVNANIAYRKKGVAGIISTYFENKIINQFVDISVEREVFTLKQGFKSLPATKTAIILNGFGYDLNKDEVLGIFASYGLTRSLKELSKHYDFVDINRRIDGLSGLVNKPAGCKEVEKLQKLYLAFREYLLVDRGKRVRVIKDSGLGHGLFFYYWKSFKEYGILGLVDRGKQIFRHSKIGLENEAKMVIDKIQHPDRKELFYVQQLKYRSIKVDRSSIAKIFARWDVANFESKFVSDLESLEEFGEEEVEEKFPDEKIIRYVDVNFLQLLNGLRKQCLYIDAPGLLVLWVYLEKLGIFPILDSMSLTYTEKGYCWFEHFLLNIARIFYGIASYSRTCDHQEPSLALFCHLVRLPCNDSFINGLGTITQKQVFKLQKWLVLRLKELEIIQGKRLGFDFHQIDLDVELDRLRQFGKGPSPKKKICYNGFRPHIAWDMETGTVITTEFRKASARGTTTFKQFVKDFILPVFNGVVEQVYIDSEYTGKHVWNFILDEDNGMGAELTACLKQNHFVRKYRDEFLLKHQDDDNFWNYYDDDHVYSSKTFELKWYYVCPKTKKTKEFTLYCVIKKNIKTGILRCFGTSKNDNSSKQILEDYSSRWIIENGIKDLIISYYLDNCPGTIPHYVNVHFLVVSICKQLYRIIQNDLGSFVKNADDTIKSLYTMRELLFRQGSAKVKLNKDTIEVHFLNKYSPEVTEQLNKFYQLIHKKVSEGLKIIGGLKVKFILQPPWGEEYKNGMKKVALNSIKTMD